MSYFFDIIPNIEGNLKLREPQIEAYLSIKEYFTTNPKGEALVVLPTGTGKSGLISIAPYGVSRKRVLVITPGLVTKKSVIKTLHPLDDNFWVNYDVLFDPEDLPIVEEYEPDMLQSSLERSNFIVANVHKLYKDNKNSLLSRVNPDFFDMVIIDEAHHSVAQTWVSALDYFKNTKKLHLTGTPYRGDGQEISGEEIHRTELSQVMALRFVKLLRKATVKNSQMYFTMPGDDKRYSKDEIIELKDKEWLEKSVALSPECSNDVIDESIKRLEELRTMSPQVPHKILAVACSIKHAEDVEKWYASKNKSTVIIHSNLDKQILENSLLKIENNECEVVVSVNMLMEGYDHKYLSILAIFRPYRSENAFAQIIGRVLRAIPKEEITDFAIDNNAFVIYHEDTGLDRMWESFQKEVEKSKKYNIKVKDYIFDEKEYEKREIIYANIETDKYYMGVTESYLQDCDFNKMYETARKNIEKNVKEKLLKMESAIRDLDEKDIADIEVILRRKEFKQRKDEIDKILIEKRPELARKKIRDVLVKDANTAAQKILEDKNIDPKGNSLYSKFKNILNGLQTTVANDGILVWYINKRVSKKFGTVSKREPALLLESQKYMTEVVKEIERML